MKIAIPLAQGILCMHFGHCEEFGIFEVQDKKIVSQQKVTPPPHQPGLYPEWLGELGVNVVITGGMGQNAQRLFSANNIQVVTGAMGKQPEDIVIAYLSDSLECGTNACDH